MRTHDVFRGTERRLRGGGAVAIALGFALAGCQLVAGIEGRSSGPPGGSSLAMECASRADCAGGELCLFARCSHTCRKDADCPAGFRCLSTEGGAACVTPDRAACATDDACPSGTTCHAGQCRSACVDETACAADQRCSEANVCVGTSAAHDPAAGPDAGPGGSGGGLGSGGRPDAGSGGAGAGSGGTSAGGAESGGAGGMLGSGGSRDAGAGGASAGGSDAGAGGSASGGSGGVDAGAGGSSSGGSGGSSSGGTGGSSSGGTGGSGGSASGGTGGSGGSASGGTGGSGGSASGGADAGSGEVGLGPTPTATSTTQTGVYTVGSYTSGFADSPDYGAATIRYPIAGRTPLSSVVFVAGFTQGQSDQAAWAAFFSSHGFVTMTIDTNTASDGTDLRATALTSAAATLRAEQTRAGSPLWNALDTTRVALMGYSMGGTGALIAASTHSAELGAVVAYMPWGSVSGIANVTTPALILTATGDTLNPPGTGAGFYANVGSASKAYAEVSGDAFALANPTLKPAATRLILSWLAVHVAGDTRYQQFIVADPSFASFSSQP